MNIVTYASPVAIQPTRCYAVALYRDTLSWENMKKTRHGVLQILQQQHAPLVQLLGKESGHEVDKMAELQQQGFKLAGRHGVMVLEDAFGIIRLQVVGDFVPCGDHDVAICQVVSWDMLGEEAPSAAAGLSPLYTTYLKEKGYL